MFVPLNPPHNQQIDGFPLEFLFKEPQTELRTLSQNCEQTLQKLRTNRIMNKRAFLSISTCIKDAQVGCTPFHLGAELTPSAVGGG